MNAFFSILFIIIMYYYTFNSKAACFEYHFHYIELLHSSLSEECVNVTVLLGRSLLLLREPNAIVWLKFDRCVCVRLCVCGVRWQTSQTIKIQFDDILSNNKCNVQMN